MIEKLVLANLITNEDYCRKVIPFLKSEYFHDKIEGNIFKLIDHYLKKYNKLPSKLALVCDADKVPNLTDDEYTNLRGEINALDVGAADSEWLIDETEKFCQDKAIYNAIMKSIAIMDDKKEQAMTKGAIPQLLSDALAVSFDSHIGHDLLDDYIARYEFYHTIENKIAFGHALFDEITKGGVSTKTLSMILAGTGVGKTMFMCNLSANQLRAGKNVLYITMEMAEERIAERIDANMLNIAIDEMMMLPKDVYHKKVERVKAQTAGKLIIKEYPTSTASASNFRYLLHELKIKKNFIPDIVYIDYINICASSRMKYGANVNSYTYIKSIAEELRGLAVEFKVPIVSATQVNRQGFNNTDFGMEDTSESFGLPMTVDFMFALIETEELIALNQILVKQLKNRYDDINKKKRFVIGVDKPRMKFYDVEQDAQEDLVDDSPAFDKSKSGDRIKGERNLFDDFK